MAAETEQPRQGPRQFLVNVLGVLVVLVGIAAIFDLPSLLAREAIFTQQYLGVFWGLVSCLTFQHLRWS